MKGLWYMGSELNIEYKGDVEKNSWEPVTEMQL